MTEDDALKVVAMLSTATGQAWSADRIKLYRSLLVESRVPFEAAMAAVKMLLMSTDPRQIYPALLIEAARRKIPDRPQLEAPDERPRIDDKQVLRKLAAHPALMAAFKRLRNAAMLRGAGGN